MKLERLETYLQETVDPNLKMVDNREKEVPFVKFKKPLSDIRIALISSGGFHLKSEPPFDTQDIMGDASFRCFPKNSTLKTLDIAHTHYKHDHVKEDLNCVLPLEMLSRLEEAKVIGSLAEINYSFMGYNLKIDELITEKAPKLVQLLQTDQVDVALIAPT